VLFDPVSSYLNQPIESFRLYRDSHLVTERAWESAGPVHDASGEAYYSIWDSRFSPGTGVPNSYRVSAVNDMGQESPLSNAVSYTPTFAKCRASVNLKKLLVIPALPADVPAEEIVSTPRLSELFVSGPLSVKRYFSEVSITSGARTWAGPQVVLWSQQQLPQSIAEYTANGASIDSTIDADLIVPTVVSRS
jgi:hypothetical protein